MNPLWHCIVIRRDLPINTLIAQLGHASGESFFAFRPSSSPPERPVFNGEVMGAVPILGSKVDVSQTIIEVRGARNEAKLLRLESQLKETGIAHVAVREPAAPWDGQLMAIGLVPGDKALLWEAVNEFQRLNLEKE